MTIAYIIFLIGFFWGFALGAAAMGWLSINNHLISNRDEKIDGLEEALECEEQFHTLDGLKMAEAFQQKYGIHPSRVVLQAAYNYLERQD